MPPLVSALILNYRSPFDCVKCVQALLDQTVAGQLEILIVDNHSDDESMGVLRARFAKKISNNRADSVILGEVEGLPASAAENHSTSEGKDTPVRFIESPTNKGFSSGNNLGATFATGDYVLIINPDNVLPKDGLKQLIDVLEAHPQAGIVGPALVYPEGTVRPSARWFPTVRDLFGKRFNARKWLERHRRTICTDAVDAYPVDWLVGACLLLRRSLFEELRGFDERFFLFFEDIDICRRCAQHGKHVLYAPAIRVQDRRQRLSDGGMLSPLLKKTTRIHVVSAVKYFWKWRGGGKVREVW